MHINAKRLKRRINKNAPQETGGLLFYGSPDLSAGADVIKDPAEPPLYTFISDYDERAALLGITITEATDERTGGTLYTIAGGCMIDLDTPPETYHSAAELTAAINQLWEIMTEPTAEFYTDNAGRLHERTIYPELDY